MPWTVDQILALAPDAGSAKSGKDLSTPRKWTSLGANDLLVWGLCQGSGKDPYQTCIDLSEPAFKCSCPSRKFPCKHSLGLFLALAQSPASFGEKSEPAWAQEWLEKRGAAAEKKAAKLEAHDAQKSDEELAKVAAAKEKRAAKREGNVSSGIEEMHLWLRDIVRGGLAALPGKDSKFYETPAARLVDNQAPGLARRVRALGSLPSSGEDWPQRFLREAGMLHLVREGWSRVASLPAAVQADLRSVIGLTENKEDLLATQPAVADRWQVLGSVIEEEDRIRTQRTWLLGQSSGRWALGLSFSAGPNQPLDASLLPGTAFTGDLIFYPSAWPQRALMGARRSDAEQLTSFQGHEAIRDANQSIAEALIACPWLDQVPVCLTQAIPVWKGGALRLSDPTGATLPLRIQDDQAWRLFSLAGGHPIAVFGEWTRDALKPISCFSRGRFLHA